MPLFTQIGCFRRLQSKRVWDQIAIDKVSGQLATNSDQLTAVPEEFCHLIYCEERRQKESVSAFSVLWLLQTVCS